MQLTIFNRTDTHCNTEQAKRTERKYLYSTFMKNNYPRNFIKKTLTKIRNKPQNNIPNEQPKQSRIRITLPYINNTSEMTARLLRPFNIDIAHKPTHKLRSYFTKHKDKTTTKQTKNAIYMIPCRDCPQRYIGQTSKKIETRITEHKNAIKRHDHLSLPAAHTYDNCHTFNWACLKEAWYSIDANTINRRIEIPTIYLQLKGKWQQNFLSSHLKETPKQYIDIYYRIHISALFGEIF